jgi:peptidoglycan/xylan/chitin deacetylase (PgdA/CDA1 family)
MLEPELRESIIRNVFSQVLGDERPFAERHYLGRGDAARLHNAGMVVGLHTHRHVPCETLSIDALAADLSANYETLSAALGSAPSWLSYPYGSPASYGAMTDRWLGAYNIRAAFTMERRLLLSPRSRWRLPRIANNDAPGGKRPIPVAELLEGSEK